VTSDIAAAVRPSRIGQCIDERYRLEAEIGFGGLGSVYRATHLKLARAVAVKLLHENLGASGVQRARFEREAKALASLEHPNIVSVMDYGVSDDQPYLVMELLEGETLALRVKRGALPLELTLSIAQQLLDALSFMHAAGLVHRDLKPSNVFLQRLGNAQERVKLLDFGLAKFTSPSLADADATLTRDGTVVGTPAYMSPEQATGDNVDARGDVYAVGVLLYQMLCGHLPYEGDAIDQVRSHLIAPIPTIARAEPDLELDAAFDKLIHRAMAKRREERFADAHEMLQALVVLVRKCGYSPLRQLSLQLHGGDPDTFPSAEVEALPDGSSTAPERPLSALGLRRIGARIHRFIARATRAIALLSVLLTGAAVSVMVLMARTEGGREDLRLVAQRVSKRLSENGLAAWSRERAARGSGRSDADQASRSQPSARSGEADHLQPTAAGAAATNPGRAADPIAAPITASESGQRDAAAQADERARTDPNTAAAASGRACHGPDCPEQARDEAWPNAPWQPMAADPSVLGPPAARDPWAQPIPHELHPLFKTLRAGGPGGDRALLNLRTYSQQHPDDPRGYLLLGQLFFNRHWRSDAIGQFGRALQLDLSARGAPEVLPALLESVAHSKVANDAARLIVRVYGSEALPAIDAALANERQPEASARLQSLHTRLQPSAAH
jgi:serine/threonine protein kinase